MGILLVSFPGEEAGTGRRLESGVVREVCLGGRTSHPCREMASLVGPEPGEKTRCGTWAPSSCWDFVFPHGSCSWQLPGHHLFVGVANEYFRPNTHSKLTASND